MPYRSLRLPVALALLSLVVVSAPASAADRCEGTLCDLYYEHMASPQPATPAQAAPARPVPAADANDSLLGRMLSAGAAQPVSPSAPTPAAPHKLVAVQGGGVIGMMNGTAPKRCTGTLCDFFYGGPPPEEPAPAATEAAVAPVSDEVVAPQGRLQEAPSETDTRSSCAVDAHDPWRCYRR